MTLSAPFTIHRVFFVVGSLLFLLIHPIFYPSIELYLALLIFFGLGIPHGALDVSLGRVLFQPRFSSRWPFVFLLFYLFAIGVMIAFWVFFPLSSFLFFLLISIFHFGFSDTRVKNSIHFYVEGLSRGILPISATAFFYSQAFQTIVESSLSKEGASFVQYLASSLFYPDVLFLCLLIAWGFFQRCKEERWNSLELCSLLLIFIFLPPFKAFLFYFCFLHSLRHILRVFEEHHLPFDGKSMRWLLKEALPSTLCTLFVLAISYIYLKEGSVDEKCLIHLFFIALSALTFPHMVLVEAMKWRHKGSLEGFPFSR